MHTSTTTIVSVLAAATLALAAPQASSLNDLPACAQQAGLAAIDATGCGLGDISCICNSVPFISTLRAYIVAHCTADEQAAALNFGQSTCAPYGVTFSATVPGITAAAATTTLAPAAGTVTSTINPTEAAMGMGGSAATTTAGPLVPSSAPTGAVNSTATLLPYTGAAGSSLGYEIAMVLAGAVGVAAFLV